MPAQVEKCVQSLLAKWSKDPGSRPTPRKGKDGKPQDAKSQAWAICQAAQKQSKETEEELTTIALEGNGMTLMGMAVTNRPHLKGLPPVKIVKRTVNEEEKELLRIPLLLQGIFKHSKGKLVFNPRVFARIRDNLKNNIIEQDVCIDSRHNPDWGALGWLGPGFSGTGLQEEDDILVAYAELTPVGKEKVEQNSFRYASAELHTNFQHPQIGDKFEAAKLSTDEVDPLTISELAEKEAKKMADNDKGTLTEPQDNEAILLELQEEREKREELEARLAKLEETDEERIKEAEEKEKELLRRLEEAEIRLAQKDYEAYEANVGAIIARAEAYRDEQDRGHPKLLLEMARATLLLGDIKTGEEDDDVITLEHEEDQLPTPAQLKKYYHGVIVYLLENLPGTVPAGGGARPSGSDTPPAVSGGDGKGTKEEYAEFWEVELEEEG